MQEVLQVIDEMDYEALMLVLKATVRRWGDLFPDWEIMTVSMPCNDPIEKKRLIKYAFEMIEQESENTVLVEGRGQKVL